MANPKVKTPRLTKNNRITKIIQQPIRYAVIEMGDYDDVRVFENELKKICGRKVENVSPAAAKEKSFQKDASPWTSYRRAILDGDYTGRSGSEPDWWYWSGHHAGFGDGKYYAESGQYGFFNELYYEAYKKYLYNKQELPGEIANATFMVTSALDSDIDGRPEERKKSNPVYAKSDAIDDCKGLMLIGCNTLSSSKVQNTLSMTFPNALIIGYWHGKSTKKAHSGDLQNTEKTDTLAFRGPRNLPQCGGRRARRILADGRNPVEKNPEAPFGNPLQVQTLRARIQLGTEDMVA